MPRMAKPLVIVESPAKARTIARFLGGDFVVESSVGHIRDLPRNAADVPAAHKGEPWARLGVDIENGFKPLYVVAKEKRHVVSDLKQKLKQASELYLATDEDREGESIAWHLLEVLSPPEQMPVRRMVFHEITAGAIREAVDNWRDLDRRLVDAQEARRILDRLYGYEVSPVLWKKVMPRLSAGRVQSVATRILVERERARMRFRGGGLLGPRGHLPHGRRRTLVRRDPGGARRPPARHRQGLQRRRPARRATTWCGSTRKPPARWRGLADASFAVRSVEEKPYRAALAPFMTSTLQQEAGRKLRFTSQRPCGRPAAVRERLHHLHADRPHHPVGDRARAPGRRRRAATAPSTSPPRPAATTRR